MGGNPPKTRTGTLTISSGSRTHGLDITTLSRETIGLVNVQRGQMMMTLLLVDKGPRARWALTSQLMTIYV